MGTAVRPEAPDNESRTASEEHTGDDEMTPEDIAKFAMMLNLDIEQGRAKLAERIQKEQEAAVQAERERCEKITLTLVKKTYDMKFDEGRGYDLALRDVSAAIRDVK